MFLAYLDVFRQQPVEQMYIGGFEVNEVLKLLNWGRLHCEESEACGGVSQAFTGRLFRLATNIAESEPRSSRSLEESGHRYQGTFGSPEDLTSRNLRSYEQVSI